MAKRVPAFRIEDIEIVGIFGAHSGGRSRPLTKSSRKQELRRESVTLKHIPTGREITIEIPEGHYSKKEMQRLREGTRHRFLEQLLNPHPIA